MLRSSSFYIISCFFKFIGCDIISVKKIYLYDNTFSEKKIYAFEKPCTIKCSGCYLNLTDSVMAEARTPIRRPDTAPVMSSTDI